MVTRGGGAEVSVVGFRRTRTRRVLIKRGINSSEINASLCFSAWVERKKTTGKLGRGREEKKKTPRKTYIREKGGKEETVFSSIHDEKVISGNPKKGRTHSRIPRESEKTISFRKPGDEVRNDKESLNLHDSCRFGERRYTRKIMSTESRPKPFLAHLCSISAYRTRRVKAGARDRGKDNSV